MTPALPPPRYGCDSSFFRRIAAARSRQSRLPRCEQIALSILISSTVPRPPKTCRLERLALRVLGGEAARDRGAARGARRGRRRGGGRGRGAHVGARGPREIAAADVGRRGRRLLRFDLADQIRGLLAPLGVDRRRGAHRVKQRLLRRAVRRLLDLGEHGVGPGALDVFHRGIVAHRRGLGDLLDLEVRAVDVLGGELLQRLLEELRAFAGHVRAVGLGGAAGGRAAGRSRQHHHGGDDHDADADAEADELAHAEAGLRRARRHHRRRAVVERRRRELLALIDAGAEDLPGADEAHAHVPELERVARFEDAALELDAVDADAVGARLVDDLEAAVADGDQLGVHAAHRAVVDGDRRLFAAPDGEALLVEGELRAGHGADDDDEPVRPLVHRRRRGRSAGHDRHGQRGVVDQLEAVVPDLDDVPGAERLLADDAHAVDERAVIALQILERPDLAGLLEDRVRARDVPVGEPNRVRLTAAQPVLFVGEREGGLLPHRPRSLAST